MAFSPYAQMPPWVRPTFDSQLQEEDVNPATPPMPQRKPMAMPPPRQPQMADAPPDFYRVTGEPVGSGMPAMPQGAAQPMPAAPPPMPKPQTALDQLQQQGRPPMPKLDGWRGYLGAFLQGGAPGLAMHALNPGFQQRQAQYQANEAHLTKLAGLEDKALGRQIQQETLQGNREYRTGIAADRDADNARAEQQLIAGLGQEVQPGEQIDTQRNLYRDYKGKKYKTPTEFAKKEADQQAKQADWIEVTPQMEAEYGKFGFKAGKKVDPVRVTQLIGFEEANGRAREANALKQMLAEQSNQTRAMIAGMRQKGSAGDEGLAKSVLDGVLRLEDLTPSARERIATKLGDAGYKSGPKLSAGQQDDLAQMLTTEKLIDQVLGYSQDGKLEGVGPITGRAGAVGTALLGTGTEEAKDVRALVGNIRGTITKLRAGTALSPTEKQMLNTYTPDINESAESVINKLNGLKKYIGTLRESTLKYASRDPESYNDKSAKPNQRPNPTQYNGKPAYKMTKGGRTAYIDAAKADQAQRDGWAFEVGQ